MIQKFKENATLIPVQLIVKDLLSTLSVLLSVEMVTGNKLF